VGADVRTDAGTGKHGQGQGETNGTVISVGSRRTNAHHDRADLEIGGAFQKGLTKDENHNVGQERRGSAPVKTAVDAHQEAQKDT